MPLSDSPSITQLAAIRASVEAASVRAEEIARTLHATPEVAFGEDLASSLVAQELAASGFEVQRGVGTLSTAIVATKGTGTFAPGILLEYDALPGIGHACGHHLIAGAGLAAAVGLAPFIHELGIRLFALGTPAEEHGGGKVLLLEEKVFEPLTFAAMFHPVNDGRSANPAGTSSQVVGRFRATYRGVAAHAASAPHDGVNAADAVTIAQVAVGLMRQQIPDGHRVALIVREAGSLTNVIPDRAIVEFECRTAHMAEFPTLYRKVLACLEAGAHATGASLEVVATEPLIDALDQNEILCHLWAEGMAELGYDVASGGGSSGGTDMGNVSQQVPSIHPWVGIRGATAALHSADFVEQSNSTAAYDLMREAAVALAWMIGRAASGSNRELIERERRQYALR